MADLAAGIACSLPQESQGVHTTAFDRATMRACALTFGRDASEKSIMNGWSWPESSPLRRGPRSAEST